MRKVLEAISGMGLALLCYFTVEAVAGPQKLAGNIPIHFDLAGKPDRWGTPSMLWPMVAIAIALYALITVVARFPSIFNFPVRVTPTNRPRLEALAIDMLAWIKAEIMCLFAVIQFGAIETVRQGRNALAPALFPLGTAVVFGTIAVYVIAMRRTAPPRTLRRVRS
jgi:hypothetical protein